MKKAKSPKKRGDHEPRSSELRWNLIAIAVSLIAVFSAGWSFVNTGWRTDAIPYDWGHFFWGGELSRRAWVNDSPYFSWLAWVCGGIISTRNYLYRLFDPTTILSLAIGTVPAMKIGYLLWQAFGAWGTARVIRRLVPEAHWTVAIAGGLVFGLQGFFLNHLRAGHLVYGLWSILPWAYEGLIRRSVLQTAFFLSLSVVAIEMHIASHMAFFFLFFGMIFLIKDWKSHLPHLTGSAILAVLLSIGVLVPLAENIVPLDLVHYEKSHTLGMLIRYLTSYQLNIWECDADCYWEYGAYVGPVFTLLGFVGLAYGLMKRRSSAVNLTWMVAIVIATVMSLGPLGKFSFWNLVLHLPIFENFHVPPRFLADLVFFLCIGWAVIVARTPGKWTKAALVVFSVAPVWHFAWASYQLPARGAVLPDMTHREKESPVLLQVGDAKSHGYSSMSEKVAISSCHGGFMYQNSPNLRPGAPMLLSGPPFSDARWDGVAWNLTVGSGGAPREWVLNQNFHPQFHSRIGGRLRGEVFSAGGNLGVRLKDEIPADAVVRLMVEPTPVQRTSMLVSLAAWCVFAAMAWMSVLRKLGKM